MFEKFVKPTIKDWNVVRREVRERDKFTCQKCGFKSKDDYALEVHHIKPVKSHPELEFDKENCITLCKNCHKYTFKNFGKNKKLFGVEG